MENVLRKLQQDVSSNIQAVDTEICYNLDCICDFTEEENEVYFWKYYMILFRL